MFQSSRLSLNKIYLSSILDSIVVSIPACHAGDRGSIPRRGGMVFYKVITQKSPTGFEPAFNMMFLNKNAAHLKIIGSYVVEKILRKISLPDGELNPGLPRDRRGYSPLYYRGLVNLRNIKHYFKHCKMVVLCLAPFYVRPTF